MSSSKSKLLEERYGATSARGEGTKKKNRRKRKYPSNGGSKVVDVDIELGVRPQVKDELDDEYDEDAPPAVVTVEDERE